MDVWCKLPDEVVEIIFSRLTVFDILRAGSSCTRFRAFVSSHTFICSSSVSLLLLFNPVDASFVACSYEEARNAWLKLPLAFLRPNLPGRPYPVASAGGLLCFQSGRSFVICNPISRSLRKLPSVPRNLRIQNKRRFHVYFSVDSVEAFGLMCHSIPGTYSFFIIHHKLWDCETGIILMLYSSSMSQWRCLSFLVVSRIYRLRSNIIISCNSRLYTLWVKGSSFVVFSYSDNVWIEIQTPACRDDSGFLSPALNAFLMEIRGSLHMVSVVHASWEDDMVRGHGPTSLHIWKLQGESNEWTEVTHIPSSILQEFHSHINFGEMQCWGKNGVMYMKDHKSDVLMFDISTTEWKWLKGMEMVEDLEGLIFEPSLSASA